MSFPDLRKLSRQCNTALLPRFFWLCSRCHTRFGLMSPRLLFEPLMKMAGCWSTWWACEDEGRWVDKSRRRRGGSEGGKGTQSIIHLFDHFSPGHRERLATVERTTERCRDCLLYIPVPLYFQSTPIMYHKCLEVHPEDQGQVMWELGIDCCSDLFSLQSIGEPPSLMSDNLINEFNPTCMIWLILIWGQTCVIVREPVKNVLADFAC